MNTNNKSWYLYIAGVLAVVIFLLLNNFTSHDLSFSLQPDRQAGEYTEYQPYLSLPKGSYTFTMPGSSESRITTREGSELGSGGETLQVTLDKDESQIVVSSSSENLATVTAHADHAIFHDNTLIALLFFALLFYIGYVKFKCRKPLAKPAVILGLILVAVFASYPLFTDYLSYGQDLNFHLYRIEGLKDGLLSGQFPVRIDPTHNQGYGYISASVYPSLFLYFPALLRLCGISLVLSYKLFLFAVNLATAFIMYGCVKAMTRSRFAGLFASVIYTLSTWRIVNLIYRAAIGEALAMTFFPVVVLGLYYILKGDRSKWWVFALGCSAIFHSHIISCIFVVLLSLVTFLVFIRDLFRERRFLALIKAALVTVLANLWYLIPFLTYYLGLDLAIRHTPENMEYFSNAIFPAEMFNFFNDQFGMSQLLPSGIKGNMSLSLGVGVTICFAIAVLYFIFDRKDKIKYYSFYAEQFLFALFILFMASTLFPNELLQKPGILNSIAGTIRMPWRFLSLASPILCLVAAAVVLVKVKKSSQKKAIFGAACLISMLSFVFFGSAYNYAFDVSVRPGQAAYADGAPGWDNEYFIYGTDVAALTPEKYVTSGEDITVLAYEKQGTNIELELDGTKETGYVEVPLLYYPGYSAKDEKGNSLEVVQGTNNVLRVNLTDSSDRIRISYSGLPGFKIGCAISILTLAGLAFLWYFNKRKRQKASGSDDMHPGGFPDHEMAGKL